MFRTECSGTPSNFVKMFTVDNKAICFKALLYKILLFILGNVQKIT